MAITSVRVPANVVGPVFNFGKQLVANIIPPVASGTTFLVLNYLAAGMESYVRTRKWQPFPANDKNSSSQQVVNEKPSFKDLALAASCLVASYFAGRASIKGIVPFVSKSELEFINISFHASWAIFGGAYSIFALASYVWPEAVKKAFSTGRSPQPPLPSASINYNLYNLSSRGRK